jgi:hypothetical protein
MFSLDSGVRMILYTNGVIAILGGTASLATFIFRFLSLSEGKFLIEVTCGILLPLIEGYI